MPKGGEPVSPGKLGSLMNRYAVAVFIPSLELFCYA